MSNHASFAYGAALLCDARDAAATGGQSGVALALDDCVKELRERAIQSLQNDYIEGAAKKMVTQDPFLAIETARKMIRKHAKDVARERATAAIDSVIQGTRKGLTP